MRVVLIAAVGLVTATVFSLLATGCSPLVKDGNQWQPVPGGGNLYWLCDGPNRLYHVDGYAGESLRVVANDPRCKP